MYCRNQLTGSPDIGFTLDQFHEFVGRQDEPRTRSAAERLAADVEAAIGEIGRRSEAMLATINAQALGAGVRIKDRTAACIDNIRHETTITASRLLRDIKPGTDEKRAARAAGRILENASRLAAELQERAETASASIIREMASASQDIRQVRDEAVRGLAELAENTMLKLAETEERGRAEGEVTAITAPSIEAITEASNRVAEAARDAAARMDEATENAIAAVRQAADAAMETIGRVIDDANARILGITEEAVSAAVPFDDIDRFKLAVLKEKWGRRSQR